MQKIIYFTLVLCAVFLLSGHAQTKNPSRDFAGGKGTEESPYLIETAKQLANVGNYVGEKSFGRHFKLNSNINFKKADFEEKGAYYNNGEGWKPIGISHNNPFEGVFDGNGKTIKGLFSSKRTVAGLFGFTRNVVIKNLSVKESHFSVQKGNMLLAAGIVASMRQGSMEHCSFDGQLEYLAQSNARVGGLVGECLQGEIINSLSTVRIGGNCANEQNVNVGGLVGHCYSGEGVKDCRVDVKIRSEGGGAVGGVAGVVLGGDGKAPRVTRVCVTGEISAEEVVGGIVSWIAMPCAVSHSVSLLSRIERKTHNKVGFDYGIGRISSASRTPTFENNWASVSMELVGRKDEVRAHPKGQDGESQQDFAKKEFWQTLGFVFGGSEDAPWVFKEGVPTIYGFDEKPDIMDDIKATVDNESPLNRSFLSLKKVYAEESMKLQTGALSKRKLFVLELMGAYNIALNRALEKAGESNLELSAAIQQEQEKLKSPKKYSFDQEEDSSEIMILKKEYKGKLSTFEQDASLKEKKNTEDLKLKYLNALSALQKKSTQSKDYVLALLIKKEIESLIKPEPKSANDIFE